MRCSDVYFRLIVVTTIINMLFLRNVINYVINTVEITITCFLACAAITDRLRGIYNRGAATHNSGAMSRDACSDVTSVVSSAEISHLSPLQP